MVEKMMVMMVVGNEEERGDDGGCTVEWIILSCFGVLLPDPLKDKNDLAIVNCRIAFATKKSLETTSILGSGQKPLICHSAIDPEYLHFVMIRKFPFCILLFLTLFVLQKDNFKCTERMYA